VATPCRTRHVAAMETSNYPPGFNHGGSHTFRMGPTVIKTRGGIVEERHTAPHFHVIFITSVAVNTILGKGDKSFLAY